MPDRFIDEARHHPGKPGKPAILAGCGGPRLRVRPGPGRGVAAIRLTHPEPGRVHRRQSQQGEHGGHDQSLAEEIDRQEPSPQRQLGVLHQAARSQRGLMPAPIALKQLAGPVTDNVVGGRIAAGAMKPRRPARSLHALNALRLAPKAGQELRDRHALLELNLVGCHGVVSVEGERHFRPATSSNSEPAEASFQSGHPLTFHT